MAFVWDDKCYIGTAGADPENTNPIGEITKCDLDRKVAAIDVTSQDDANIKAVIAGNFSGSFSASANCLLTDTNGQTALETAFSARTPVAMRFNVKTGNNNGYGYYFDCVITGHKVVAQQGNEVTVDFTFEIDGAVTYDADAA